MADLIPKPGNVTQRRAISPEMFRLLDYLQNKEVISGFATKKFDRDPHSSVGAYRPSTKRIGIIAGSTGAGDVTAGHEIIHALKATGEGKYKKWMDNYNKLGFFDRKGLVRPQHWLEGKVGNPITSGRRGPLSDKTNRRNLADVEASILEGQRWSGLRPASENAAYWESAENALTYARTDPRVKRFDPVLFGMFLHDYRVPEHLVEGAVKALKVARPGKAKFSGGSANVSRLLDELE